MKTLAVRQPWITYQAEGIKTIEVRSWRTHYRGPLLLAASGRPLQLENDAGQVETLPTQVLVCTVDLVDCRPLTPADFAAACLHDWKPGDEAGMWAWVLDNPQHVQPVPHRGRLNLYDTPDSQVIPLPEAWHYLDFPSASCQRCNHPPGIDWLDNGETCPACRLVQ